jgi:hypothetical protein
LASGSAGADTVISVGEDSTPEATPSISTTRTTGGSSSTQWCTQGNYTAGDFSYTCTTTQTDRRYSLTGFSIGIGIR